MSNISIEIADIAAMDTDCVVNAANEGLWEGTGVCGAIFRAAGAGKLQKACDAIGGCPEDEAWRQAVKGCSEWIGEHPDYDMDIVL